MRKIGTSVVFILFITFSFSQRRVEDENKLNQLRSIEFMQWKFSPDWYYYSWVKRKVFGVKVKIPGMGIHDRGPGGVGGGDNYVRKYNRNITQTSPLILETIYDKKKNIVEGNMIDTIYKQETAKFLDRTIDKTYFKFKKIFSNVKNKINYECALYLKNSRNGLSSQSQFDVLKNVMKIKQNTERISSNIKIVHKSHISSSKKMKAYQNYEKQLKETLAVIKSLNSIENILNKKY